jgi:phospholipid/cholesterol/gamma-HCH transport system substrate-binding protein
MNTTKERFKIRLGLFVLVGLALFVLAVFIIGKQKNLFDSVFTVKSTFYNVSGLQVGNVVRFSGINVGTVDNIKIINDSTVQVEMLIKQDVQKFIKSDSEVGIGSEGIIGDRLLIISQGSTDSPMAKNGQMLVSSEPIDTDAIIESLEATAMNAEIFSAELSAMMVNINSGKGTLGRLIQDSTIADNLSTTMYNLKQTSKGLDESLDAVKDNRLLRGHFKRKQRDELKRKEALKKSESDVNKSKD